MTQAAMLLDVSQEALAELQGGDAVREHQLVRLPLGPQPLHCALARAAGRCLRAARQPPAPELQPLGRPEARPRRLICARAQRAQALARGRLQTLRARGCGGCSSCATGAARSGALATEGARGAAAAAAGRPRGAAGRYQRWYARCGARYTCLKSSRSTRGESGVLEQYLGSGQDGACSGGTLHRNL